MPRVTSIVDLQEIPLGDSKGAIYRRTDIADSSWFFRMHLKKEKRYYRVSLKTKDRSDAKRKAQSVMLRLLVQVEAGQPVMAVSLELGDLVRAFHKHLASQVQTGQIRDRTERIQRYRVQLGLAFLNAKFPLGLRTKVMGIDGEVFKGYLTWRQAMVAQKRKSGTLRRDVVRDELIVVRKMFKYALSQKMCTPKQVPVWDFAIEKEPPIRRRITIEDVNMLMEVLPEWTWDESVKNPADKYHRLLLMQVVLLVEASGMRSGEVFGLRNKYAVPLNSEQVRITVKAETSKIGRDRSIIVRAPVLIDAWLDNAQLYKEPDDYLFSTYKNRNASARDVFYHAYQSLRRKLEEIDLGWIDLYHCRHWYITQRLLAGESIHLVAKAVGTSVSEIEKTYSNVLTEQITEKFGETYLVFDDEGHFEKKQNRRL